MTTTSPDTPASSPASGAPEQAEVLELLEQLARTELEREVRLRPETDLARELALDSVGWVVLAVGLENRYRIRLHEEDAAGLVTAGDLALLVRRRVLEPHR